MDNSELAGMLRAGIAAVLGVVLAISVPYVLAVVEVPWEQIVMLTLLIVDALLLGAAFVLATASQIYASYAPSTRERSRQRLLLMANVFLLATVGVAAIMGIFAYVLAIIRVVL